MGKRIDAAIDPDGRLPREKVAEERRRANVRDNHDGPQTLTWRDTDEQMAAVKAAMFALAAPAPAPDATPDGTPDGTPDDRSVYRTYLAWSDWFLGVAWDSTTIAVDQGNRRVHLLALTDTDRPLRGMADEFGCGCRS